MIESEKEKHIVIVKEVFKKFIQERELRNTPERMTILEEIYSIDKHFNVDWLYDRMKEKNYRVSRATIYNSIDLLMECKLIRKHQFSNQQQTFYEKSYFDKQHDHIILIDSGEIIEFCDPRIQTIKNTLENIYGINIESHSLYFYAKKKNN